MDIDDEKGGSSWHEHAVPGTTVYDEIEWGNIQQSTRGGGADGMQGGWARRQGKHDCSDDDEEQCHPHPKMRTSRNNDHCQHQREAFDN